MEREWSPEMITRLVVAMLITVPLVFAAFLTVWEWPWVRTRLTVAWHVIMSITTAIAHRYVTRATPCATETKTCCEPIATPCNACNAPLRVANVADVEAAQIATLATLIRESTRKPFANGKVSQTRALKAVFGVTPSSSEGSEYQRLLRLLREALKDNDTPVYRPVDDHAQPIWEDG